MIQPSYQAMIPGPIKRAMIADYHAGMTFTEVQKKWSRWPKSLVRTLLQMEAADRSKPKHPESVPNPDEIARLRDLTKDSWSPEETGSRWVGRRSVLCGEAGRVLSRLLRR